MSILEQVFNEDATNKQLNELTQPYSRTQSAINRSKSAVKGLVGGGQYEQGAEAAGQLANSMFLGFKRYIGTKYGKKPSFVTYNDVAAYMKQNGMDIKLLGSNQNMTYTPKDVAGIFLKGAQEMSSRQGDGDTSSSQGNSGSGTPPAPAQNGQGQGGSNVPPSPAPQGGSGLSGTLSSLSAQERQQILSILSRLQ